MSFTYLTQAIGLIVTMTVLACISKFIGCGFGAALTGFNRQSSFVIGAGMISRGEMGMITAQIGYQAGVLSRASYSEFVVVIILATMVAPLALKQALKLLPKDSRQGERSFTVDASK